MSADPERAALDAEILAWMGEDLWESDDARFDTLALRLFAHQFDRCAPYRGFCEGRGATPATVSGWQEIPAVPTGAFKELALRSFPTEYEAHLFRTSGTSTSARGALHLDTLALYEGSLLPTFRRFLLPDLAAGARAHLIVLAPSREEAPDSSLSHMFDVAVRELGDATSHFAIRGGSLDVKALVAQLARAADAHAPLLVCGAAFAFVHWLDALEAEGTRLTLPPHTRLMETGGFKGRARERSREVFYAQIEERLGVPEARIVNQYGMTELGSQFYDTTLSQPGTARRKQGPPWARVHLVEPETGAPARSGDHGMIRVVDLANTGSISAIETADLGCAVGDDFDVLGRDPYAEARGCSIAIDELLGGARP